MPDKNQNEQEITEEKQFTRERLLILSSSVLKKIEDRVTGQRFREQSSDATYLGYIRALSTLITAHNAVMKDQELSELEQRLSTLENEAQNKQKVRE